MKLLKVIGTAAFALCTGDWAGAAYPPLDRPTPPPCCADNICYPNAESWGWYQTRWRRWPTDLAQGAVTPPAPIEKLGPDIPPYETPTAEDEDRRAPPPTKPKAEEGAEEAEAPPEGPPGATPPTTPILPRPEEGLQPTPQTPLTPPQAPLTPPGRFPWEENGGETTPPARMPWETGGEPTGDVDPPPTLPSVVAADAERAPMFQTPTSPSQPQQPRASRRSMPTDDPPPKLPIVLASTR